MPNPFDDLKAFYDEKYYGQQLELGTESTFTGFDDLTPAELDFPVFPSQPEHIPNYEKLTAFEKKMIDALPGLEDSWVAKAGETIANAPVLKQLFDAALAMSGFAEKAIGTAYLLKYDPDLQRFGLGSKYGFVGTIIDVAQSGALALGAKNWMDDPVAKAKFESAWLAAANFYEAIAPTNILVGGAIDQAFTDPRIVGDRKGFDAYFHAIGKILFTESPEEAALDEEIAAELKRQWEHLGDVFAGRPLPDVGGLPQLIAMRQQLYNGANPEDVRNNYFTSLGAVAIRSQVFDAVGQAVIDPMFYILPRLRVTERLRYFRHIGNTSRVAPQIMDSITTARDILRGTDNVIESSRALDKLADVARTSDLDEFVRLVDVAREAVEGGEDVGKAFSALDDYVATFDHLKEMGKPARVLMAMTGGDPLNPPRALKALGKVPVLGPVAGVLVKAVTLTPKSRAIEFVEGITTAMRVVMKVGDDPIEWIRNLTKGGMGIFGKEFGHAFVSPVGRHVQSVIKAWIVKGSDLGLAWTDKAMKGQRLMLEGIARALGTDIVSLMNRLQDGGLKEAETVMRQLTELATTGERAGETLVDASSMTASALNVAAEIFRSTPKHLVPFTPDMFRAALLMEMVDVAHEMSVLQFGVGADGFFKKLIQPIKAAESLVLLGLNPNYPMQNLFNNEITTIARGLSNTLNKNDIAQIWGDFGMRSGRLNEAFTIAGEFGPSLKGLEKGALGSALQLNQDLLRAIERGSTGVFDKFTDMINNLPIKDMRSFALTAEKWQGNRVLTQGLVKAWKQIAPRIFPQFDEVVHGLGGRIEQTLGTEAVRTLRESILDARKVEDIDDLQKIGRMQLNIETITRRAAENLGMDADRINFFLGDEIHEATRLVMKSLDKEGVTITDIEVAFDQIAKNIDNHLNASLTDHIPVMIDEFAAKVATTGPAGVMDIHGQVMDDIFARQADHSKKLDEAFEVINSTTDPVLRNRMVKALFAETDAAWARTWDYAEAAIRGIEKGLEGKFKLSDDFVGGIKGIRNSSQGYIKLRNNEWGKFFDNVVAGKYKNDAARIAASDVVYAKLDNAYQKLITNQDDIWRAMDEAFLGMFDDQELVPLAAAWRGALRDMRKADMQEVATFRESIRGLTRGEISAGWVDFNKSRLQRQLQIQRMEKMGRNLFAGDTKAKTYFRNLSGQHQLALTEEAANIQGKVLDTLAAGLAEDGSRIARQAVGEADAVTVADFDPLIERQLYQSTGIDENWYRNGSSIVQEMERVAKEALNEPALNLRGLDDDTLNDLNKWFEISKGELNDGRHVAVRMAESYRDSAMLNYRRQYGFDAGLGYAAPFAFWTTHSVFRWAIHSLDHPAMLATWAKSRQFMDTVIGDRQNLPRRLRGRIKIQLPFVPEEFGGAWVDPLRAFGLPFEQFLQPVEYLFDQTATLDGRIDNKLQEWLSAGEITNEEYNAAIGDQNSELYSRARNQSIAEDQTLNTSALDFMNLSVGLHLPFQYALKSMQGRKDELAPLPHTRTIKNVAGLLGIDPGYYDNTWGNVRRAAGLPGFDQWEPYRIDRELSNMVAEGKITVAEMQQAMFDNAERVEGREVNNPILDLAWKRTTKAQGFSNFYRLLGIPLQPYPVGEENLRNLYEEFGAATKLRDSTGSPEPVTAFFEEHPEFEARLALWDEPEERMSKFLVDQLWDQYHNLSSIDRRLARDQLGEDFVRGFLDKDTANPLELDPNVLAMWLKQMGGEAIGGLGDSAIPIEFAPAEISDTIQQFYDVRNLYFPDYFKLQNDYYDLAPGKARRDFRNANPQLTSYWDWRREFLTNNPDTVSYLSEDFEPNYASREVQERAQATQPNFGIRETQVTLLNIGGSALWQLAQIYAINGQMSATTREAFVEAAQTMGISISEFLDILRGNTALQ